MAFSADLEEIRAVGQSRDGRRFLYSLTRPDAGWSDDQLSSILNAYGQIDRQVLAENLAKIRAGELTVDQADSEHYHQVITRLSETFPGAFNYERTDLTDAG